MHTNDCEGLPKTSLTVTGRTKFHLATCCNYRQMLDLLGEGGATESISDVGGLEAEPPEGEWHHCTLLHVFYHR